jgi:excinuclease ABC subunit C
MGKISSIDYKEKIKGVKDFLEGKFKTLSSNWKKEMQDLSAQMLYEEASQIRDNLYALEAMAERVIISEISVEDIEKSIFKSDSLKELQKVLHLDRLPSVIEGFDNSNMQGKNAVSSMVRFFNGSPDKQNYRKFKIKTVIGADDFASIYEVVFRRYSALIRKNEKMPDLVVIDGGKGQLSFAKKALDELKLPLPLISLAKRNEEIFMPFKDKPLVLDRNSPALNLLQNVRDEAHRFAINYHRFLRKKSAGFENKK